MSVTNGTLQFAGSFSNRRFDIKICSGGVLKVGDNAVSQFGDSGTASAFTVQKGGRLEIGGEVSIYNYATAVKSGGTLIFAPSVFKYHGNNSSNNTGQQIVNEGTAEFPGGIKLEGYIGTNNGFLEFPVRQQSGIMTVGGDVCRVRSNGYNNGDMAFVLAGGVLNVTADVSFLDLSRAVTEAGTAAELRVAEGATLDMSPFKYGDNTVLTKTGAGRIKIADLPASLAVQSGVLCPLVPGDLAGVSFAPQTTLEFCVPGFALQSLPNAAEMNFTVDVGSLGAGVTLVTSADETLLATIASKIAVSLPAGLKALVVDGALKLDIDNVNSFSSSGELSLGDASGWKGGSVPAGADVFVTGGSTVALLAPDTPEFKSVTVTGGAVLKVAPGTVLPRIATEYSGKVLFEAGGESVFTNGYSSSAARNELPVIEIAEGAVVNVGGGFEFKNVDLRLYGKVSATNSVVFGGAAAGETAYFAMTADGGTIELRGKGGSVKRFVSPAAGGRVEVVRDILIKNTAILPDNSSGSASEYSALQIGYFNPADAVFTVTVDGCYLDIGYEPNYIAGGATVKCVNGGGLLKPRGYSHPGFHAKTQIIQKGRIELESGSYFKFSKSDARTDNKVVNSLLFSPDVSEGGFEQLVLRGGSSFCVHQTYGNGKASAVVDNAYWDIPLLLNTYADFPDVTDTRKWLTDPFNGFHSVKIADGSCLYIRATNDLWGATWDRDISLADVPMTGGGSLIITNAASGNDFRVTVVASANTATGIATALPDVNGDNAALLFNDGANWGGTVVANGHVALTNLQRAAAARVAFNALRLDGDFPVRVWPDSNDMVDIAVESLDGDGCLVPVAVDGREFAIGETFAFGTYPAGAGFPERTGRNWKLIATATDDPAKVMLNLRYSPRGFIFNVR
jgi:hypothetical protein